MKFLLLLNIAALLWGCSVVSRTPVLEENANALVDAATTAPVSEQSTNEKKRFSESIGGIKGLIVLGEEYNKPNDLIRFYNEDGSFWYEFTFYYDDTDGDFEYRNDNFRPYSFHPDYFTLALKMSGETADRYEVIVNEETGLKKYVEKISTNLRFESWQDHILRTFAIEFDKTANPLRTSPNGVPRTDDLSTVDRFQADEIDGDWLRVKWDKEKNPNDDPALTDSAWIRWRERDILLIEWFYFA